MPNLETDFEPVACPLCGADEPSPFVQAFDRRRITESAFQLVRCGRCSLVYQNPRVRPSSISKYYSGNYHSSRAGRKEAGAKPVARERRKCQIIEEPGIRPPGTVLDVGCTNSDLEVASGELLARTRRQGGMITVQARRP